MSMGSVRAHFGTCHQDLYGRLDGHVCGHLLPPSHCSALFLLFSRMHVCICAMQVRALATTAYCSVCWLASVEPVAYCSGGRRLGA